MRARLYKPAKTAMSSGVANTKNWVLEFVPQSAQSIDPLMGWCASSDTQSQVHIHFDSKEAALEYAQRHGIDPIVQEPQTRAKNVRKGGYADNFATGRRTVWTH